MWPTQPQSYVQLPQDASGLHYGLWVEKRLVSVISLFMEGERAQFRKFATETSEQGKGYGSQLLRYVMAVAKTRRVKQIWCNARVERVPFYQRFGLEPGAERFSKGGQDYVIMEGCL